MITLLLVSVALTAATPIMSKKIKSESVSVVGDSVPPGAIMFFDSQRYTANNGCPKNWTNISAKYNGKFLKINSNTAQAGDTQNANLPNHWHAVGYFDAQYNNDTYVFSKNYQISTPTLQSWQHRWLPGDEPIFQEKLPKNYPEMQTWGFGTSSDLFPASNLPLQSSNISSPTNNFDVYPANVSLIACQKD